MGSAPIVYPGGPCTCAVGRYVRYAIPPIPGIPSGAISCRDNERTGDLSVRRHEPPAGAVFALRVPEVNR